MVSEGWNRRTVQSSVRILRKLKLLDVKASGAFPRFENKYYLSKKGLYVADFVRHLREILRLSLGMTMEDLPKLPKGCMSVLIYLLSRRYKGITRMLEELSISPHQAYRCLASLESKGILRREEHRRGKTTVSFFRLSENGVLVAVAMDALDRALKSPPGFGRRV